MTLGPVLDVAMGLAFIFTLLAIIASAVQEMIASVLSTRGKVLQDMLVQMLDDKMAQPGPTPATATPVVNIASFPSRVVQHPIISGLATSNLPEWLSRLFNSAKLPSYVPASSFTTALVEVLREGHDASQAVAGQIGRGIASLPENSPIKRTLQGFMAEAKDDVDAFRTRVQTWYDDCMDRASGVYKRYAQYMLLVIGLILAVLVNADVISVGYKLWHDQNARTAVASAASQFLTGHTQSEGASSDSQPAVNISAQLARLRDTDQLLAQLPVPLGWSVASDRISGMCWGDRVLVVLRKLLGLLLTAFAVSLGAPFWFDALQNIANLRGAGPKPDEGT